LFAIRRPGGDPQKTISSLKLQVQLAELRDTASLVLLELSRQNYGLARDYSGESPRHSTFSAALYMTRLGLPINASDFWVIRHEFEFSELLLPY